MAKDPRDAITTTVPPARTQIVQRPSLAGRRRMPRLRMALSTIEEAYYVTKNVTDHVVGLAERLGGRDYLDFRLNAYAGQKRVAFLFHGYFQGRSAFERMERLLESDLFNVFAVCSGYQPYSQDIRKSAEGELRAIERVLAETDARQVILIGHSQGGLIARYLLQRLGVCAVAPVSHVVTMCTPHMGTWAAAAGTVHGVATGVLSHLPVVKRRVRIEGESALQMIPGSSFLSDLNGRPLPEGVAYTNLYNYIDPLVWPPSFARLPYPEATNVLFKKIGHLHALYDVQELEVVLRTILSEETDSNARSAAILHDQPILEERTVVTDDVEYGEFVTGSE